MYYLCPMKIEDKIRKISGIYQILNLINNKSYIGSSLDMYQRAYTYKCLAKQNKIHNKHLQSAINLYGFNNFEFKVLDKMKLDNNLSKNDKMILLQNREQIFIDNIKPEYNIRILVDRNTSIIPSEETRLKISISTKEAYKNGTKKLNRIYSHNIKVSLFDEKGDLINNFPGLAHCADFVGCASTSIGYAIYSKRRRIRNYIVLKTEESDKIEDFINIPRNINTNGKRVKLLDTLNNKILEFINCKSCAISVGCKVDTITNHINKEKLINKRYKVIQYG